MYEWQIQTFDKQSVFLECSIKLITFCQKYENHSEQHVATYVNDSVEWKKEHFASLTTLMVLP